MDITLKQLEKIFQGARGVGRRIDHQAVAAGGVVRLFAAVRFHSNWGKLEEEAGRPA